jgi:hypothetical protein
MADKDLAKVLEGEEKRKREAERQDKPRKRPAFYNRYGGGYGQVQPSHYYPPAVFQPPPPPPPLPIMQGQMGQFQPRQESRSCLFCRMPGHLIRNCPNRPPLPAAQGAPPK